MEPIKTQGNFIAYSGESRRAAFASEEDLVLFEAAPDLLECLQNLVDQGLIVNDNDHYEECITAIAKATEGE